MKIVRADHWGMCFGVRDALAIAHQTGSRESLTILGELVHNPSVLADLRQRGIQMESDLEAIQTPTVMITAHGASSRRMAAVRGKGYQVIDATCPLVHFAHRTLAALVAEGHHPVVIGLAKHVEVRGLVEDYPQCDVVLDEADIERIAPRASYGVVAQTTQPVVRVRSLVACLERRFPSARVHFRDTVCLPTKQRQEAAVSLARQCSIVIVVGGRHSNNTRELVETIRPICPRVHHVEGVRDLRAEWFDPHDTVGLTAGTSSPPSLVMAVENVLRGWADPVGRARSLEEVVA